MRTGGPENRPLLTGGPKPASGSSASLVELSLLPFAVFVLVSAAFGFLYDQDPEVVTIVTSVLVLALIVGLGSRAAHDRVFLFVTPLCLAASVCGALAGIFTSSESAWLVAVFIYGLVSFLLGTLILNILAPATSAGFVELALIPLSVFVLTSSSFAFLYHYYPDVVVLTALLVVLGMSANYAAMGANDRSYLFMGALCFMAGCCGAAVGWSIYEGSVLQYMSFSHNREYTNVLPSEPAAAHSDAGIIRFAPGAHLDSTKAVGYKADQTFCVAPIMDAKQGVRVEYWAVGVDCCATRNDFQCDDAATPCPAGGCAGLVLRASTMGSPETDWASSDSTWPTFFASDRDLFSRAVELAEASSDLVSAPNPIFVRWVQDPETARRQYSEDAWGYWLIATVSYGVLSLMLGTVASKR